MPLTRGASGGGPVPGPGYRLPAFWSRFVGRRREMEEVAALLGSNRLVTLTGAGGIGKTRLAVAVAERLAPGRAFFVDLTPLRDPNFLDEEVASAFALGELRDRRLADVVAEELGGRALLLLDNCEHLAARCADLVRSLLEAWGSLHVLVTSQQRLGVRGEVVWRVPALEVPGGAPEAEEALESTAVQLFCERAAAVQRGFVPSHANLDAIVEICRRLDGNPLAIELAAARVDTLAPADIAARLEDRFGLLRGMVAAGPARHQTLRAALEWSHELLSEPERVLLRRLSVFSGGFGLAAVADVCAGGPVEEARVVDLLGGLVAKSLVAADTGGPAARYRLLETVRHYATDALAREEEAAEVGERHVRWCIQLLEQADEADEEDVDPNATDAEQDNIRAALEWCLAHGRAELALRLVAGEMQFWQGSGRFAEARDWLTRVLAASGGAPAAMRASAWHDLAFMALLLGDFEAARAHASTSLELWSEAGDVAGAERTRGLIGVITGFGGGPDSVERLERDLEAVRATGDDVRLAEVLVSCAYAWLFRGELVAAHRRFEELVPLARRSGDDAMTANALVGLGAAALGRGDYGPAESHLREGVELTGAAGQDHSRAVGELWLAELARLRGDAEHARAQFEQCLVDARALDAPYPLAKALVGVGRVLLGEGEAAAAEALFEEAAEVAGEAGQPHMVAAALGGLGEVALADDDAASAESRFERALHVARQFGDRRGAARATYHLAVLARAGGALAEATSLHLEALAAFHDIGDRAGVADSLEAMAGLCAAKGNPEVAARLFGAGEAVRRALGGARPPRPGETYDADVGLLAEQLAADERQAAWAQGAALGYDEAVAYATRGRGVRERPATGPESLTPAERDIARLGAEGLTNPEIAERLFVSPRTVQSHLRRAYGKLGVSSRRELRQALGGRVS